MEKDITTHVAFADETKHNQGRFRGVALISLKQEQANSIRDKLQKLLKESGIKEFKWEKLRSARERFAAIKIIEQVIPLAAQSHLRVDVLTWDINDSRHKIVGRDDMGNLERMYFHLLKNVLQNRWASGSTWILHPDEQTGIDWNSIQDYLSMKSKQIKTEQDIFSSNFKLEVIREFGIKQIVPMQSHKEPLVQVADLFVGIGAYSREYYDYYVQWKSIVSSELTLFPSQTSKVLNLTSSHDEKCRVLDSLDKKCKKGRFRVSLRSHKGLRTLDPSGAVNFWWYVSQHKEDKAPIRKKHSIND